MTVAKIFRMVTTNHHQYDSIITYLTSLLIIKRQGEVAVKVENHVYMTLADWN